MTYIGPVYDEKKLTPCIHCGMSERNCFSAKKAGCVSCCPKCDHSKICPTCKRPDWQDCLPPTAPESCPKCGKTKEQQLAESNCGHFCKPESPTLPSTPAEKPKSDEKCPKCGHLPCKSKVCIGHCIDQISGSMVICDCDCQSPTLPAKWKADDNVGLLKAHAPILHGPEGLPLKFDWLFPQVQRSLNGKSDEKLERLLAVAMELLKDAAPCDLETVNLDEQAWWNKLNHLKAELESSKLQIVDGLPVREGEIK